MALSSKIAINTGIQVATKIISTLLSLAALALVTRYLGSYGFGNYTTAITFVTFFSIAADLGLTLVTTQLISHPGANQDRLFSNLFTFRIVTAVAILIFAPIVSIFLPYDEVVKQGIPIASIAFFFVLMNQVFTSLFQKELRAEKMAYAEIISRALMFILMAAAAILNWGMSGIIWAMAIANILSFLLHYFYSRSFVKISLVFEKEVWLDIIKRSWPFIITIVLNLVYLKTDTLLLSLMKSPTEVGLYGAAYRVVDVLVSLPFMLGGTVLPVLTRRWHAKQFFEYERAWVKIFNAMSILVWPLMIGGLVLARPIMTLVAGQDFVLSGDILKVLIFAVGGVFFSSFFSYTMISFGEQKRLVGAYVFTALSSLVLYFIFIPDFSYFGAAWVTVYSEVVICLLVWRLVKQHMTIKLKLDIFIKSLIASLIMGLAINYLPFDINNVLNLVLAVLIGTIIYGLIALWSKTISYAEIKELLNRQN